ncbi:glycosyltransferase [Corynebacterium sp. HMSC05H05]|uniref:glycosyltransferase family protein n=1 Tax=Corynebacterium sp. HMSC05H05 TaxID=1581119 RepID=UPI000AF93B42|nr:glycosyltransferase [Corynebacterium sp. HMSC05H05]
MPDRVESSRAQAVSDRNRFNLRAEDFWLDNTLISAKRRGAAVSSALRNGAEGYLNFLAYEISEFSLDWCGLHDLLWSEFASGGFDLRLPNIVKSNNLSSKALAWCEVAVYLVLAEKSDVDLKIGADLLKWAAPQVPRKLASSSQYRELLIQLLIRTSQVDAARKLLAGKTWLDQETTWFYRAQCERVLEGADKSWVDSFNRLLPPEFGLILGGDEADTYDSLRFSFGEGETRSSAVRSAFSVVVPVEEVWELELLDESLRSVKNQTAQASEILVVVNNTLKSAVSNEIQSQYSADVIVVGSGTDQGSLLKEGVDRSSNETVFVQLPNSISHPRRFEFQLADMASSDRNFSFGSVVATDMSLGFQQIGYTVSGVSGASLCFDKRLFDAVGDLLPLGRMALDEFLKRLHIVYPGKGISGYPLAITRSPDGRDFPFLYGQVSEQQRLIDSGLAEFHLQLAESVKDDSTLGLEVQEALLGVIAQQGDNDFDVVLAGDWRKYGGPQKSMIEEIHALVGAGYKVGVLHMEAARFMTVDTGNLCRPIQQLINKGYVGQIAYNEPASTKLLILRYPPILQVVPEKPSMIYVQRMVILANQAPSELDGSDIRYTVPEVSKGALHCFGVDATWAPQGPQVRRAIEAYLAPDQLEKFDMPGIVNPVEWRGEIPRTRLNELPVIGRHSRDNPMKWPEDAGAIESAYPTNGTAHVRSMGGTSYAQQVLGLNQPPENWDSLAKDAEPVVDFLHSLDYYVFFQHSNAIEAFGRAVLEAIAANLVVILQRNYEEVFGEAAIYADPEEVADIIRDFQNDPQSYAEQQLRAADKVAREFSYESHVDKIRSILKRV